MPFPPIQPQSSGGSRSIAISSASNRFMTRHPSVFGALISRAREQLEVVNKKAFSINVNPKLGSPDTKVVCNGAC